MSSFEVSRRDANRVEDFMTIDPVVEEPTCSLSSAIHLMEEHGIRHLPVIENERLMGIVSDRDLMEALPWPRDPAKAIENGVAPLADIMQREVIVCRPADDVLDVVTQFLSRKIGCLPVVGSERLIGIVTEQDVIRLFVEECQRHPESDLDPHVSKVMTYAPTCAEWFKPLGEAIELLASTGFRHLPVLEGDRLVGMLSERDLRRAMGQGCHRDTPIEEVMNRQMRSTVPEASLSVAAKVFLEHKVGALPVLSSANSIVGILTTADLFDQALSSLAEFRKPGDR